MHFALKNHDLAKWSQEEKGFIFKYDLLLVVGIAIIALFSSYSDDTQSSSPSFFKIHISDSVSFCVLGFIKQRCEMNTKQRKLPPSLHLPLKMV